MKRGRTIRLLLAAALSLLPLVPVAAAAQVPQTEYEGSAALGLALRRLGATQRVLMVGAHPDDESTQILSTLALGHGAQVAYLSLTRGEGGQNGIGPELQEALGLLRTEELLAARRLDGARQYFTRAYDYGFSKNAEEAFLHWPRDSLLADVVAVVRHFRPDVILAVFSGTPRDGHGQHQASGILAREAFEAAGDPRRFPEQLANGLRPHAPAKLYQALWRPDGAETEVLETGNFDPLFGRSHFQIAMASRSRHRSQDMGQILEPGPRANPLRLIASRVGEQPGALFEGIDTLLSQRLASVRRATEADDQSLQRLGALLDDYQRRVADLRQRFNPLDAGQLVPDLAAAARELATAERLAAAAGPEARDLVFRIAAERAEAEDALWRAAGLVLDAIADDETIVPGQEVSLELTLWNGGRTAVALDSLAPRLPAGWRAQPLDTLPARLAPGSLLRRRFRVSVPADAALTEPYFLRRERSGDLYRWTDETGGVGLPFQPEPVVAAARVRVGEVPVAARREATFRALDKVQGELRRPLRVVPAVSLVMDPVLAILPLGREVEPRRFSVRLRSEAPGGVRGTLRLRAPEGWRVQPGQAEVSFAAAGEEQAREFTVHPPAGVEAGKATLAAAFETADGRRFDRGFALIDYPHTQPRPLYRPATATLRALDVRLPSDLRVGYVAGPGDEVPAALAQLGVRPELIGPEALATGDLGVYDVIVTGIRAYEVRPDLVAHNQRLLDYVRRGGTLIAQYNKYEFTEPGIAPYPVKMSRPHDRVTDETAPVRILDPEHPIFAGPNRITAADFEGWVQERGLYFLSEWDSRYTPLLEMADPGEEPKRGALLVAPYGEGTYVYTGLALFRQLPAGVPGAYRLFANLLSLGAK